MSIHTVCPQCQSQFVLQDELAGKQVQCQNCQAVFVAPAPNSPTPAQIGHSAPTASQQDTFLSVFEQVSAPQSSHHHAQSVAASAPPYGGHVKKTNGNGMLIGGVVAVAVALLGLIGFGVSYAWNTLSQEAGTPDLADTDRAERPERSASVERMIAQYGEENVVRLVVNVSHQPNQSPQTFLLNKVKEPIRGAVGTHIHRLDGNNYEVYVGPVSNFHSYSAQLTWLDNKKTDQSNLTISGYAMMPPDSIATDTAQRLAAAAEQRRRDNERRRAEREEEEARRRAEDERKHQERLAERQKREEERAREDAIRDADRKHQPRPGETTVQWLTRCLDESSFIYRTFESLSKMQVDEEIRAEISELLVKHYQTNTLNGSDLETIIKCFGKWRTDESDQLLINMMKSEISRHTKGEHLLPALAQVGTAKAADAMGTGLADSTYGDKTARALISMGEVAEQATLNWRKHEKPEVRFRVYHVLAEIGTRASIDPLKENRTQEKDFDMKRLIRDVLEAIEERHPEG